MTNDVVPVIDLGPFRAGGTGRRTVAQAVARACEASGFFCIVGHGVDPALVDEMRAVSRAFFALPLEQKLRACPPSFDIFRGYFPMQSAALAQSMEMTSPPDVSEAFCINRFDDPGAAARAGLAPGLEKFFHPNIWPEQPPTFRAVWTAYYAAMEQLSHTLAEVFALALGLPDDWFADKIDEHVSNLLCNYYPALDHDVLPGQFGRGQHTDYGSFTILHQEDRPKGLQVRDPRSGEWRDVPCVPDSFVINLGDLMAFWTADRWVSTLHRAVGQVEGTDRLSIAFFHQPNYHAVIQPFDASARPAEGTTAVTSGEWVTLKNSRSIVD